MSLDEALVVGLSPRPGMSLNAGHADAGSAHSFLRHLLEQLQSELFRGTPASHRRQCSAVGVCGRPLAGTLIRLAAQWASAGENGHAPVMLQRRYASINGSS